ncbi:Os06g0575100, partial [Oryza sativa Japonica Group]
TTAHATGFAAPAKRGGGRRRRNTTSPSTTTRRRRLLQRRGRARLRRSAPTRNIRPSNPTTQSGCGRARCTRRRCWSTTTPPSTSAVAASSTSSSGPSSAAPSSPARPPTATYVNFIARAIGGGSSCDQRLFFAEVRKDKKRYIPTCLWSLDDEADRVGGAGADPQVDLPEITSPSRRNYWFSCDDEMKHPKDGTSYHAGHFL